MMDQLIQRLFGRCSPEDKRLRVSRYGYFAPWLEAGKVGRTMPAVTR